MDMTGYTQDKFNIWQVRGRNRSYSSVHGTYSHIRLSSFSVFTFMTFIRGFVIFN